MLALFFIFADFCSMIYHLVVGDAAAKPLKEAVASEAAMEGEVVVLRDVLSVGPLQRPEGMRFSEMRGSFWQAMFSPDKPFQAPDDLERLLHVGNQLSQHPGHKIWLWMAPLPADVCAYYWASRLMTKYLDRFFVVSIYGLPFLDTEGKIFYPRSLADLSVRELVKARKLARTPVGTELENIAEEWPRLEAEQGGVRLLEGEKRLVSKPLNHYDAILQSACTHQFQKGQKVVHQVLTKQFIPTGDVFLGWRLRCMAETGKLVWQGDLQKGMKDFEVRIPGDEVQLELAL